jgi:uncharacterized protein with HEPN domain
MLREAKAYLWDIANAAASIHAFTAGKDLNDYLNDEMLRAAVERKFGIVGEALSIAAQLSALSRQKSRSLAISSPFATRLFTVTQQYGTTSFGR